MTIKVLHCIARMNAGGTATLLDGLMSQANPQLEQILVYGRCEGDEIDYLRGRKVSYTTNYITDLARSIHPLRDAKAFLELRKLAKTFSPDIIHTHTFKAGLLGRVVALTLKKRPKLVHTFHGHLLTGYFPRSVTKIISLVEASLARVTDVIVTVGPQIASDLLQSGIGSADQYVTILPGISEQKVVLKEAGREALGLRNDLFTIGFVGRLTAVKRIDRFLDALSQLSVEYQAFVAGDGGELENAIKQARAFEPTTHFLGWREDIDNLFAAADVIVLTSDNEGFGLVLVEAQLRGTPVIATDVGSVSSALINGKTGYLVSPDALAIRAAIERIANMSPSEFGKMSADAHEFALESFSLSRFARDHQRLYADLLNSEQ